MNDPMNHSPNRRQRPLLLLADDDPELLGILRKRLGELEADIITATNGKEAVELAISEKPNAIVLDVMMPRMNGWEACKTIRATKGIEDTPIMMLTGIGETLNEMTSPLYGANDHIDKPFDFSELLFKLRRLLARQS